MLDRLDTSNWTKADAIREAKLQTEAIQRLKVWLRLGYSSAAIGFLLAYGGFVGGLGLAAGIAGAVLLAIGAVASVVLKAGVTNGTRNVENILQSFGIDLQVRARDKEVETAMRDGNTDVRG